MSASGTNPPTPALQHFRLLSAVVASHADTLAEFA